MRKVKKKSFKISKGASVKRNVGFAWKFLYPVYGVFSVLIIFAGLWIYFRAEVFLDGVQHKLYARGKEVGFSVQDIVVEGRNRTSKELLFKAMGVKKGDSIWAFNPHIVQAGLEKSPWVEEAFVQRQLPDTVYVKLQERIPLAVWQSKGKHYVIDRGGKVIEGEAPQNYSGLTRVVGQYAARHAPKFIALLEQYPELVQRLTAASHVRGKRWDIRLDDRVDVKLPEENTEVSLKKLIELDKEYPFSKGDIMAIDMRFSDKIIFRQSSRAEKRNKTKGRDV